MKLEKILLLAGLLHILGYWLFVIKILLIATYLNLLLIICYIMINIYILLTILIVLV